MGLIQSVQAGPQHTAAGAAFTLYLVAALNPSLCEKLDIDDEDVTLAYEVRLASSGALVKSGTLAIVTNLEDDFTYYAAAAFAIGDALAGQYIVKVYVSSDVDLGDSADPDLLEQFGTEVDSDDIAAFTTSFTITG